MGKKSFAAVALSLFGLLVVSPSARAVGDDPGYTTITVQAEIGVENHGVLQMNQNGCLIYADSHGGTAPVVVEEMTPGYLNAFTSNVGNFLNKQLWVGGLVGPAPSGASEQIVHQSTCTANAPLVFYIEEVPQLVGETAAHLKLLKSLARKAKLPEPVYFAANVGPTTVVVVNYNYYKTLRASLVKAGAIQFFKFEGPGTKAPKKKVKH